MTALSSSAFPLQNLWYIQGNYAMGHAWKIRTSNSDSVIHTFFSSLVQNGAREVSGAVDTVEGKTKKARFD
jgi:hypothetical protein